MGLTNKKKTPSSTPVAPATARRISEPMPIVECDERPFRLINPFAADAAFQAGLVPHADSRASSGVRTQHPSIQSRQSRCDPFAPSGHRSIDHCGRDQHAQHPQPSSGPFQPQPNNQHQHQQQSHQQQLYRQPQQQSQQQARPSPPSMHLEPVRPVSTHRPLGGGNAARPRLPPGSIPTRPTAHEIQAQHQLGGQSPAIQFPPSTAFQQMHLLMGPGGPGATPFPCPLPPPIPQSATMDLNPSHYSLLTTTQAPFPIATSTINPASLHHPSHPIVPGSFEGMPQHPPPPPPTSIPSPQRQTRIARTTPARTARPVSYPTHPPSTAPPPNAGGRPGSRSSVHFNPSPAAAAPAAVSLIPKRGKSCLRPVSGVALSGQSLPWETAGPADSTPGGAPPRPRSAPPVSGSLRSGAQLLHRLNVLLGSGSGMVERFVDVHKVMEPGRVCAMQAEPAAGGGMKKSRSSVGAALGIGQTKKSSRERAFGLSLESAPDGSVCQTVIGSYSHKIPYVVFTIVEEILQRGMSTPGIFRLVGDSARCLNLYSIFNSGPSFGRDLDVGNEPIHNLCGVLKLYLRELPEPLVHPSIWRALLAFCVEPDPKQVVIPETARIAAAQILLRLMPPRYFSLLVYLLAFLTQVPKYDNRLTQTSVSIIFGPMLVAPRGFGIPSIGPSDQPLKVPAPATNSDGSIITPRPSQDYSGLVGQSQAILLWLTTNWDALSDGLFELDLDIGDIGDDQAQPVVVASVAPPARSRQQPFREPELVHIQHQPPSSSPVPAVRNISKAGPTFGEAQPTPLSRTVATGPAARRDSDEDSIRTLNDDDNRAASGKGDYFGPHNVTTTAGADAAAEHHQQLTQLVALIHEKDRQADEREAVVARLKASIETLTRERDHARKAQEQDGQEGEGWKAKCREMEFAKNRAMIELANQRSKVQELTIKLSAPSIVVVPSPSEEDDTALRTLKRQHDLQLKQWQLKVSEISALVDQVVNERDQVKARLSAVLGAVDSARG